MALHAFVAMPFGLKEGIDFDAVYREYIAPALARSGFEIVRADDTLVAGGIHADMFQELLLADLVVVDISIDNPNVWYELGARHALRSRGVVHVRSGRDRLPFDVQSERTFRYHVTDGRPDPAHLAADIDRLAQAIDETIASWRGRPHSPVYQLLTYLREPDWRSLKVGPVNEYWDALEAWQQRVELARQRGRAGDVLVLAEEAPTWALGLETRRAAGKALSDLGQPRFALEQFELALKLDPDDRESRQMKAVQLGRLGRYEAASIWLQMHLKDQQEDAEAWALLGRVRKQAWIDAWRTDHDTPDERCAAAAADDALLRDAIDAYCQGFELSSGDYYPGVNALTLKHLLIHVSGDAGGGPEIATLEGGVRWAAHCALAREPRSYWPLASLAELAMLSGTASQVTAACKAAVAVSEKSWFKLDSSRQQLHMLHDLGFRPESVAAGLAVFDRALARIATPAGPSTPGRRTILFSGHMVDRPDRAAPRFPPDKVDLAAVAIAERLDEMQAGPDDVALCGGANGGDLLFAEACLARDVPLEIRLPFDEPTFLRRSVTFAGEAWRDRYYAAVGNPRTLLFIMPDELGPTPKDINPFARNNRWQLGEALARGPERVRFLCLWDGKAGDGPGGTKHLVEAVEARFGRVSIIDIERLFFGSSLN